MTSEERNIMQQHVQYWKGYMNKGMVIVFGPVLQANNVYGLGIVSVESEEQVKELIANDPRLK